MRQSRQNRIFYLIKMALLAVVEIVLAIEQEKNDQKQVTRLIFS